MQKNIRCINLKVSKQPLEKVAPNSICLIVTICSLLFCYFAPLFLKVDLDPGF